MKLIHRLSQFIDYKGISLNHFDETIGSSNGYIGKQIKRGASIGSDIISSILEKFPDLSVEWLYTGEGEMLKNNKEESSTNTTYSLYNPKYIPLIAMEAVGGYGAGGDLQAMVSDSELYVIPQFSQADFMIPVRGSSMYPKYSSGDIVACKRLSNFNFFQWNKIYVIDTEQGVLIKRIQKGDDDKHILIVSENEKYPPFNLHVSEIRSVSIVLGCIKFE